MTSGRSFEGKRGEVSFPALRVPVLHCVLKFSASKLVYRDLVGTS